MNEFDLIERIRARVPQSPSVALGIGDDAAVLELKPGRHLVATTDSLVLDRHFTVAWPPADVGHMALAVNLSDLAAMAATPRWALLALTLPEPDAAWLDGFLDGFLALAETSGVALVGGNISSGPLNIGVQALGEVEPGRETRRSGARPGDWLVVTGTLGDAGAALALGESAPAELLERLRRPVPRLAVGCDLGRQAHAMIDISDGLAADLGRLLTSGLGVEVEMADLPTSPALKACRPEDRARWSGQASAGNDYELLAAVPSDRLELALQACARAQVPLTVIGRFSASGRIAWHMPDGEELELDYGGWDHFRTV